MAERKVESNVIVFDELPPEPTRAGGGGRASEFDALLENVHNDRELWRKPVSFRQYGNETGAKAARNVLRQRLGRSMAATGHDFAVRNVPVDGVDCWHLFVIYDPSQIEDGAWELHVKEEAERIGKIEAKRQEKLDAERYGSE